MSEQIPSEAMMRAVKAVEAAEKARAESGRPPPRFPGGSVVVKGRMASGDDTLMFLDSVIASLKLEGASKEDGRAFSAAVFEAMAAAAIAVADEWVNVVLLDDRH